MNTPTLTGAYTCTHHTDAMRAACPVCFGPNLTAERDRLRAEVEKVYALVTPVGFDLPGGIFETAQAVTELRSERDQLRDEVERVNALGSWAHTCIHHTDEQRAACPVCLVTTLTAECDQLRAELATERARLDWLESNADDIMKYNCRSYIWFPHQNLRAAIDAGMKEGA